MASVARQLGNEVAASPSNPFNPQIPHDHHDRHALLHNRIGRNEICAMALEWPRDEIWFLDTSNPDNVPLSQLNFIMTEAAGPIIFDKQHALNRLGGLEDVLRDVMELMTTESRRVHAEIGDSYRRGDSISLKRSAHTLKGSMGLVGAKDLVQRLKRVEDAAATGDLRIAVVEFDEIDRQFAELQRLLALELEA